MNSFTNKLILGSATSATQIEGGDKNNSWYDWYLQGKIKDGSDPSVSTQHYRLYKEDTALLKELGMQAYRMGIEWAKIQPTPHTFNEEVLNHYKEEITLLLSYGIKPLVTLHHFTNPMWFEKAGGFLGKNAVEQFLKYVEYVVVGLGDLVEEYITINEPNVYALNGYVSKFWPPGKFAFFEYTKVQGALALCHIKGYNLIHKLKAQKSVKVGYALSVAFFEAKNGHNPFHVFLTKIMERNFQTCIFKAFSKGVFTRSVKSKEKVQAGNYSDFIGINYYMKNVIYRLNMGARKGQPVNDLNWQIYPKGIAQIAKQIYKEYKTPIYVTENGVCDNTDAYRCKYIYEHLKALNEENMPVERYYHWSFIDNFEWSEGNSGRFGLVHVDYQTMKRTVKKSGEFYKEIIANNGVTEEMYEKYVKDEVYPTAK